MFPFAQVKIETNNIVSKLFINGENFSGALAFKLEHKGGDFPILTVMLPVNSLSVDGEVKFEKEICAVENGTDKKVIGSPLIHK